MSAATSMQFAFAMVHRTEASDLTGLLKQWRRHVNELIVLDAVHSESLVAAGACGAKTICIPPELTESDVIQTCRALADSDWILWFKDQPPFGYPHQLDWDNMRRTLAVNTSGDDIIPLPISATGHPSPQLIAIRSGRSESLRREIRAPETKPEIDVIVLSYAKSRKEYEMTTQSVISLLASEPDRKFNVVVVETASREHMRRYGEEPYFSAKAHVIFPEQTFNYNAFLQIGWDALKGSSADYLLIANNDLVFHEGFAVPLVDALREFASVSPWCPDFHERFYDGKQKYYPGFRTSIEVCGWAMLMRKDIFLRMPFEEIFPTDFAFWFQDNYFAHQLRKLGLVHSLVAESKVTHLFAQSHELMDDDKREEMTIGQEGRFYEKLQADRQNAVNATPACDYRLSVIIRAALTDDHGWLQRTTEMLDLQAKDKPVELLAVWDNGWRTLDQLTELSIDLARGDFIAFVERGDQISDDFIANLLQLLHAPQETHGIVAEGFSAVECQEDNDDTFARWLASPIVCIKKSLAFSARASADGHALSAELIEPKFQKASQRLLTASAAQASPATTRLTTNSRRADRPLLTVGVLGIPRRLSVFLEEVGHKLVGQAFGRDAEVIFIIDNQSSTIGRKRNFVLQAAQGEYVTFVDDDDDVADEYTEELLSVIQQRSGVDCIVFDAWVTLDDAFGKRCRYGIEHSDEDLDDVYLRRPNHICCWRSALAKEVPYRDISWHEDFLWAQDLAPLAKTQSRIDKCLYHYRFSASGTAAQSAAIKQRAINAVGDTTLRTRREIVGFWHIAQFPNWERMIVEQQFRLQTSGLYDEADKIYVGVVGSQPLGEYFTDPKFEVMFHLPDLELYERPTLEHLHAFCCQRQADVFYFHTKGISHQTQPVTDWRNYLEYFTFFRQADCRQALTRHDVAGVNLLSSPSNHFSGNFWWARSEYVRTLPSTPEPISGWQEPERTCNEAWILSREHVRAAELHHSGLNHYLQTYPRAMYARVQNVEPREELLRDSGWRGLENLFQDLLETVGDVKTVVEIGVDSGYSLFCFAQALPHATVIGIDPYSNNCAPKERRQADMGSLGIAGTEDAFEWVSYHMRKYPNVILLKSTSVEASNIFVGSIDVIHLDGRLEYENVADDFARWIPKVRDGGCVLFHDTISFSNDVNRFFASLPGPKFNLQVANGLGVWYKAADRT